MKVIVTDGGLRELAIVLRTHAEKMGALGKELLGSERAKEAAGAQGAMLYAADILERLTGIEGLYNETRLRLACAALSGMAISFTDAPEVVANHAIELADILMAKIARPS